jgi:hypothetical protein
MARQWLGGIARSKMANVKALQKENDRLKRIVAELELDKLILTESLDYLTPKASRPASFAGSWFNLIFNISRTHDSSTTDQCLFCPLRFGSTST